MNGPTQPHVQRPDWGDFEADAVRETHREIVVFADRDMSIVFGADVLAPPDRLFGRDAAVVLDDGPGTRQRMVERGDFVMQEVRIGFVEVKPLLDDRCSNQPRTSAGGFVLFMGCQNSGRFE